MPLLDLNKLTPGCPRPGRGFCATGTGPCAWATTRRAPATTPSAPPTSLPAKKIVPVIQHEDTKKVLGTCKG
jgi:hypothetical protein